MHENALEKRPGNKVLQVGRCARDAGCAAKVGEDRDVCKWHLQEAAGSL